MFDVKLGVVLNFVSPYEINLRIRTSLHCLVEGNVWYTVEDSGMCKRVGAPIVQDKNVPSGQK